MKKGKKSFNRTLNTNTNNLETSMYSSPQDSSLNSSFESSSSSTMTLQEKMMKLKIPPKPSPKMSYKQRQKVIQQLQKMKMSSSFNKPENSGSENSLGFKFSRGMFYDIPEPNLKDSNSSTTETNHRHDASPSLLENASSCLDKIKEINTMNSNDIQSNTESEWMIIQPEKKEFSLENDPSLDLLTLSNTNPLVFETNHNHVDPSDLSDRACLSNVDTTANTKEPSCHQEREGEEISMVRLTVPCSSNEMEDQKGINEVSTQEIGLFLTVNESTNVEESCKSDLNEDTITMNHPLESNVSTFLSASPLPPSSSSTLQRNESNSVILETYDVNNGTSLGLPLHETELHNDVVPSALSNIETLPSTEIEPILTFVEKESVIQSDSTVEVNDVQQKKVEKECLDSIESIPLNTPSIIPVTQIQSASESVTLLLPTPSPSLSTLEGDHKNSNKEVRMDLGNSTSVEEEALSKESSVMNATKNIDKMDSLDSLTTLQSTDDSRPSDGVDSKNFILNPDLNSSYVHTPLLSSHLTFIDAVDTKPTFTTDTFTETSTIDMLDSVPVVHAKMETHESSDLTEVSPKLSDSSKAYRLGEKKDSFITPSLMKEPSILEKEMLNSDSTQSLSLHDVTTTTSFFLQNENKEDNEIKEIDLSLPKDNSMKSLLSTNMNSNMSHSIKKSISSSHYQSEQQRTTENESFIPFIEPKNEELSLDTISLNLPPSPSGPFQSYASLDDSSGANAPVHEPISEILPVDDTLSTFNMSLTKEVEIETSLVPTIFDAPNMVNLLSNEITDSLPLGSQILDTTSTMNPENQFTSEVLLAKEQDSNEAISFISLPHPIITTTTTTSSMNDLPISTPSETVVLKETMQAAGSTSHVEMETLQNASYVLEEQSSVSSTACLTLPRENLKVEPMEKGERDKEKELEPSMTMESFEKNIEFIKDTDLDSISKSLDLNLEDLSVQSDSLLSKSPLDEYVTSMIKEISLDQPKQDYADHPRPHQQEEKEEEENMNLLKDDFNFSNMESSPILNKDFQLEEELIPIPNPSELASALVVNELLDECPSHPFKNNPIENAFINEDLEPYLQSSQTDTFMQGNDLEDIETNQSPLSSFKESPALEVNVSDTSYIVQERYDSIPNNLKTDAKQEVSPLDSAKNLESFDETNKVSVGFVTSMDTPIVSEEIEMNVKQKPKGEIPPLTDELSYKKESYTYVKDQLSEPLPVSDPKSSTAAAAEVESSRSISMSASDNLLLNTTTKSEKNLQTKTEAPSRSVEATDSDTDAGLWKTVVSILHQPGMPPALEISMHLSFFAFIFALFIISYFTWGTTVSYYSIFLAIVNVGLWLLTASLNSYNHSRSTNLKEKKD